MNPISFLLKTPGQKLYYNENGISKILPIYNEKIVKKINIWSFEKHFVILQNKERNQN